MPNPEEALQKELETYQQKLPELLQHSKDHFVLIKGDAIIGTYANFELAYTEGLAKFGLQPFLIKKVRENEPLEQIPALTYHLSHASL